MQHTPTGSVFALLLFLLLANVSSTEPFVFLNVSSTEPPLFEGPSVHRGLPGPTPTPGAGHSGCAAARRHRAVGQRREAALRAATAGVELCIRCVCHACECHTHCCLVVHRCTGAHGMAYSMALFLPDHWKKKMWRFHHSSFHWVMRPMHCCPHDRLDSVLGGWHIPYG